MILGMSTSTFTLLHVLISLIGIGSGLIALYGLLSGKLLAGWTFLFLVSTALTSITGFLFPVEHLLPSHKVGILSLFVLALAIAGLYLFHLAGKWRVTYVISALSALYLNSFVGVVQSFMKIPALHAMAPRGKEPPFLVAQTLVLLIFIALGIFATKRFRGVPVLATCFGDQEVRSRVRSAHMEEIVCCQWALLPSSCGSRQADSNTSSTVAASSRVAASME